MSCKQVLLINVLVVVAMTINYPYDLSNQKDIATWGTTCASGGLEQSPIDIIPHYQDWHKYRMTLIPSSLTIKSTLQKNLVLPGAFMQLFAMDMKNSFRGYISTQMTYHQSSEHKIEGLTYDAEIQLHFKETTRSSQFQGSGVKRNKAVVSFLLTKDSNKVTPGVPNVDFPWLQYMKADRLGQSQSVNLEKGYMNMMKVLLAQDEVQMYQYNGSGSTFNNCDADVTWYIYQPIFRITDASYLDFNNYMIKPINIHLFSATGTNNRAIQPTNNRKIVEGKVIANLNSAYSLSFSLLPLLSLLILSLIL